MQIDGDRYLLLSSLWGRRKQGGVSEKHPFFSFHFLSRWHRYSFCLHLGV